MPNNGEVQGDVILFTYIFRELEILLLDALQGLVGLDPRLFRLWSADTPDKTYLTTCKPKIILICADWAPTEGERTCRSNASEAFGELIKLARDEGIPSIVYGMSICIEPLESSYSETGDNSTHFVSYTPGNWKTVVHDILMKVRGTNKTPKHSIGQGICNNFCRHSLDEYNETAPQSNNGFFFPSPDYLGTRYSGIKASIEGDVQENFNNENLDSSILNGYPLINSGLKITGNDEWAAKLNISVGEMDGDNVLSHTIGVLARGSFYGQETAFSNHIWLEPAYPREEENQIKKMSVEELGSIKKDFKELLSINNSVNRSSFPLTSQTDSALTNNAAQPKELFLRSLVKREIFILENRIKRAKNDSILAYVSRFGDTEKVLLTAIDKEREQCLNYIEKQGFSYLALKTNGDFLVYLQMGSNLVPVIVSCVGDKGGIARTASKTMELFKNYNPKVMVLAGIAAGLGIKYIDRKSIEYKQDDTPLGDLVIGTHSVHYEIVRLSSPLNEPRMPEIKLDSSNIISFSRGQWLNTKACEQWEEQIKHRLIIEKKLNKIKKLKNSLRLKALINVSNEQLGEAGVQLKINIKTAQNLKVFDSDAMSIKEIQSLAKDLELVITVSELRGLKSLNAITLSIKTIQTESSTLLIKRISEQRFQLASFSLEQLLDKQLTKLAKRFKITLKTAKLLQNTDLGKASDKVITDLADNIPENAESDIKSRIPLIHSGYILSGDKLLADADAKQELLDTWANQKLGTINYPILEKLRALEMETAGFTSACEAIKVENSSLQMVAVRGICDHGDGDKNDRWHNDAATAATSFSIEWLLQYNHT